MPFQNCPIESNQNRKQSSPQKVIIRSRLFRQKFQKSIPKVYDKQIIIHHPNYASYLNTEFKLPQSQKNPQIWGCLIPPKRKSRSVNISQPIRKVNTPQNLFRKYIVRKSRLSYGPQVNPQFSSQQKRQKTAQKIRRYKAKDNVSRTVRQYNTTGFEIKQDPSNQSFLTNQDIINLNSKSIYKMSLQELQHSIRWKKQFLQIFHQKMNLTKVKAF